MLQLRKKYTKLLTTITRSKPKIRGGKKLGSGGYGVAFTPAIQCISNKKHIQRGTIGKLFFDQDVANDAWELIKIIKKIDSRTQKYFIYPTEMCVVTRSQAIAQEPMLEGILNKKNNDEKSFMQHIMPHGGTIIKSYLLQHYSRTQPIGRAELVYILENLFYAVKRLDDYKYVHQDIKLDNIVISNKNRLRLIDFDLLYSYDDFYSTSETVIRELYNGNVTSTTDEAYDKYDIYAEKCNEKYKITRNDDDKCMINNILGDAMYNYVSPPEYYIYSKYSRYLIESVSRGTSLRAPPVMKPESVRKFVLHKNNYGENIEILYNRLDLHKSDHVDDINRFIEEVVNACKQKTLNPLKDFYMHHNLAAKSDIYSIGLIILRICTFNENILKRETDESTVEIHIVDDIVNGPRIVQSATSRSTQINIVDAFNILLQGLLWHNPINRFSIKLAIAWVKILVHFFKLETHSDNNPFKKNKDSDSLKNNMKTSVTPYSVSNSLIDNWFTNLNNSEAPKKSRFTLI